MAERREHARDPAFPIRANQAALPPLPVSDGERVGVWGESPSTRELRDGAHGRQPALDTTARIGSTCPMFAQLTTGTTTTTTTVVRLAVRE
jgi:hypothetical protein